MGYFWVRLEFNALKMLKLALALAIVFAIGTVASGPFISKARSTKGIMTMIQAEAQSLPTKVAVPRGNPFSAYFYSSLGEVELQAIDQDRLLGSDINNLIIKSRDKDQLSAEIQAQFQSAGEWGKYLWMKRTAAALGEQVHSK